MPEARGTKGNDTILVLRKLTVREERDQYKYDILLKASIELDPGFSGRQ